MKNCHKLNLPIKLFDEGRLFLDNQDMLTENNWKLSFKHFSNFLTPETIDLFASKNIPLPEYAMIFRGRPGGTLVVHLDYISPGYAINIAWGSRRSEMIWYKPLIPIEEAKYETSSAHSPYYYFESHQVEEIERTEIKGPCLVRTDIPHNVVNYDTENIRWCLSLRFPGPVNSWDSAVEFFKPYFIE